MTTIKLQSGIEADLFQVKALCQSLRVLQRVHAMGLYDLLSHVHAPHRSVTGPLRNVVHRLQTDLDHVAQSMGMPSGAQLLDGEGRLSPFFMAVLQSAVVGSFPNYVIKPPLTRTSDG